MPSIRFSGLASGIDGDAVIQAIIDAKRTASIPIENKVAENENENKALEEFNTKLLGLNGTLQDLLSLSGGAVNKKASTSNEDSVSATASNAAVSSSTTVNVTALAKAATLSFDDRFTTVDQPLVPGLGGPATIDITVGQGASAETFSISVDSTTTLTSLAASISEVAPNRFQASVVNAGTQSNPQYALLINGLETGTEDGTLAVNVDPAITGQGLFGTSTLDQAADAVFSITGLGQIVRSTNQVADLIPGVTLNLKQANTGPVTISVISDPSKTAEKVSKMIDSYNELLLYSKEGSKVTRDESDKKSPTNVYGPLGKTRVDEQAITSIRDAIANARSNIDGSAVQVMADLGITTQRDGTLAFDSAKFTAAISSDPVAGNKLLTSFADAVGTQNGVIANYTKFQGIIDTATTSNEEENTTLSDKLARIEDNLDKQTQQLRLTFANLEATVGRLYSQGSALTSALSALQK